MPRSKWKGLFCDVAVSKHVQKVLDGQHLHTAMLSLITPPMAITRSLPRTAA